MANPDHVIELMKGFGSWNSWLADQRKTNPNFEPDLSEFDFWDEKANGSIFFSYYNGKPYLDIEDFHLDGANLKGINFAETDLGNLDLRNSNLQWANLETARFKESNLEKSNLTGAKLVNSHLDNTNLESSILDRARLQYARLNSTNLKNSSIRYANLNEAILIGANLNGSNLRGAQLIKAKLGKANLNHAKLDFANLENAKLAEAQLENTDLNHTQLKKCNCSKANFKRANLSSSNLAGADLTSCNFKGADLRFADLRDCNVAGIIYDRGGKYCGIRLNGCHGNQRFVRHAMDQAYLEELQDSHLPWERWFYKLWLYSSDCGRSLTLWAFWSLLFALVFGTVYAGYPAWSWLPDWLQHLLIDIAPKMDLPSYESAFSPYYFSIVTFTTLGFGDIHPSNMAGEIWVTLEVILGYVMLGGLISIFANKLARRSG